MVVANAPVDIPALKARHSLGDTVEASGVRLRGRGRVRQGVCPFHDEAEGSFTVYGDSERFYCFGCGAGGDVLDFIRRAENLSLPEAIARLDGSPEPAPRAANRPAGPRQPPEAAALPPRDPNLLTAAALLRRAIHGAGSGAVRRYGGCSRPLQRPRQLARGPGHRPRPDAPVPGVARPARPWRRRSGFRPCSDAGPPPSPFPPVSATWPSLRPFPRVAPSSSACSGWRPAPPAGGCSPLSSGLLVPPLTRPHSHRTGGPMPNARRALPAHGFP